MRIGITGATGKVGKLLVAKGGIPLACDVTRVEETKTDLDLNIPDIIVHCAGYSGVDFCQNKKNQELVIQTNYLGSYHLFLEAEKRKIPVVFLSSDHVFGGTYGKYREDDKPDPVNYYGLVKFTTELMAKEFDNVKIVRTSTLFDLQTNSIQGIFHFFEKWKRSRCS